MNRDSASGLSIKICSEIDFGGLLSILSFPNRGTIASIELWVLEDRGGYTYASLENSLNEGLGLWWNSKDPGHWNSPTAVFDGVISFKFSR